MLSQATPQVGVSLAVVIAAVTLPSVTVTTPPLPLAVEGQRLAPATRDAATPLRFVSPGRWPQAPQFPPSGRPGVWRRTSQSSEGAGAPLARWLLNDKSSPTDTRGSPGL